MSFIFAPDARPASDASGFAPLRSLWRLRHRAVDFQLRFCDCGPKVALELLRRFRGFAPGLANFNVDVSPARAEALCGLCEIGLDYGEPLVERVRCAHVLSVHVGPAVRLPLKSLDVIHQLAARELKDVDIVTKIRTRVRARLQRVEALLHACGHVVERPPVFLDVRDRLPKLSLVLGLARAHRARDTLDVVNEPLERRLAVIRVLFSLKSFTILGTLAIAD